PRPSPARHDLVLIATGSEVALALEAARRLAARGRRVRVVSMPSWELFERQAEAYRREVLPEGGLRLAVEAGSPLGWHRWVGERGEVVALSGFGASAPAEQLAGHFGLTPDAILARAEGALGRV
ncbi:MAG: transketolase, partial [Thermoanaerobaculia bacterium]